MLPTKDLPGHESSPQDSNSSRSPGQVVCRTWIFPESPPRRLEAVAKEVIVPSWEVQFLSLVRLPPPQDWEQELQGAHSVHSSESGLSKGGKTHLDNSCHTAQSPWPLLGRAGHRKQEQCRLVLGSCLLGCICPSKGSTHPTPAILR